MPEDRGDAPTQKSIGVSVDHLGGLHLLWLAPAALTKPRMTLAVTVV